MCTDIWVAGIIQAIIEEPTTVVRDMTTVTAAEATIAAAIQANHTADVATMAEVTAIREPDIPIVTVHRPLRAAIAHLMEAEWEVAAVEVHTAAEQADTADADN